MNKKVDEEFKGIKDVYVLQCICTELKELCDKYEEEHSNEFQCWKRDRKELLDKRGRIQKASEYIKHHTDKLTKIRVPKLDFNYEDLLEILEGNNEYNK